MPIQKNIVQQTIDKPMEAWEWLVLRWVMRGMVFVLIFFGLRLFGLSHDVSFVCAWVSGEAMAEQINLVDVSAAIVTARDWRR